MSTFVGRRLPPPTVRLRRDPLRVPLAAQLLWALLKLLAKVLVVIVRSPVALVAIGFTAAAAYAVSRVGFGWTLAGTVYLAALVLGVILLRPAFGRRLRLLFRSRWRRWSLYRWRWAAAVDMAELTRHRSDGTEYAPVLGSVKSTLAADTVRARMLTAQTVTDWGKVSDRLAQAFGADACRVRSVPNRPRHVDLSFIVDDVLARVVEPADISHAGEFVDLAALPIALREDGETYCLPLLGNHVLLSGAMGSGKSSVEWAIIHALAPAIADRTVRLWGLDPKRMELAFGESLFEQLESDFGGIADLLEAAVTVMQDRQGSLAGVTRTHVPTADEPLLVLLADELAALSYITDRDLKRRIENALALLLSQGRAVGVSVIGCVQDPRKEVIPQRGLYTVRIALRLTEADDVALVLGRGAYDRGARADEIPESLPGVAYVAIDGVAEPVRVRFAHVTDEHIRDLAAAHRRPLRLVGVSGDPMAVADPTAAPEAA